jgi:hypothetical protein
MGWREEGRSLSEEEWVERFVDLFVVIVKVEEEE